MQDSNRMPFFHFHFALVSHADRMQEVEPSNTNATIDNVSNISIISKDAILFKGVPVGGFRCMKRCLQVVTFPKTTLAGGNSDLQHKHFHLYLGVLSVIDCQIE
jgi:hypothetical protein